MLILKSLRMSGYVVHLVVSIPIRQFTSQIIEDGNLDPSAKYVEISLSTFLYNGDNSITDLESKCTKSPVTLDVHRLGGPHPAGAFFGVRTNRL
jgi:hypothetical protein